MAAETCPGAEDLEERANRLCERFPAVSAEKVHQVLQEHAGHAGYAAATIRALITDDVKQVDPDDSEHVATLLCNRTLFKEACRAHFKKFDMNRNGTLEWEEVLQLTNNLCSYMGIEEPTEKNLQAFFEESDANHDGVLAEREFPKFFESFLRYAFFMQHRRLVGTWRIRSSDPSDSSSTEFTILVGKDYRLYYRSGRGGCPWTPKVQVSQGRQEAYGTLELHEGYLQCGLKLGVRDSEKRFLSPESFVGGVRLRSAEGTVHERCGGIMDKVIINFRRDPEAAWGNDIKAVRKQQMQEEDGTKSFLHGYNVSGSKGSRAFLSPKSESSMRLSPKSGSMPNLHSWT